MDDYLNISRRFERLRQIIVSRERNLMALEKEVLYWFELSNIAQIEMLMQKKEEILSTNHKLRMFVMKWEKETVEYLSDKQLYTSV